MLKFPNCPDMFLFLNDAYQNGWFKEVKKISSICGAQLVAFLSLLGIFNGHSILQATFDIDFGYLYCIFILWSGTGENVGFLQVLYF